ncbi:ATP-binding protein [Streptomyces sp. NPDC101150]|uniref:ATP-binding protein n=1 Tax=Streptomyces sp. NPDC101150 TaxID=3366114 RepID=UPI00381340FD
MSARARSVVEALTHVSPVAAAFRFPSTGRSIGLAREALRHQLRGWGLVGELAEDAVLLVSEMVTNAVKAEPAIGCEVAVRFVVTAGCLRLEVHDASSQLPVMTNPEEDDECGRGLVLLNALASGWGVITDGIGKTVWVELVLPDNPVPSLPKLLGLRNSGRE